MIITVAKITTALIVGIIAICAGLLGVASGLAHGSTDPVERKDATITAFWSLVVFALCAGAIISLSGCMSAKELACLARDNTSRPCN